MPNIADIKKLETHFQCRAKMDLLTFYDQHNTKQERFYFINPDPGDIDVYIERFLPLVLESIVNASVPIPSGMFPFAEDEFGNYLLTSFCGQNDLVYFINHENPSAPTIQANSFNEFIARQRADQPRNIMLE